MKVTGAMLRDALRRWGLRLESAHKQFDSSLHVFPGREKEVSKPQELVAEMNRAEDAIARLQVAQARYNLAVTVKVGSGPQGRVMTLTEAVKRVGGAGRIEALWRKASMDTPILRGPRTRSVDEISSVRTVSHKEAVELAVKATGYAESLRAAINRGNQTEIEIEDLDPVYFE